MKLEASKDAVNPARQYCYNALAATNEKDRAYWCVRFVKAMRPIIKKGKIQRHVYRRKFKPVRPVKEIISERK